MTVRPGFDHRTTDTLMDSLSVDDGRGGGARLWRRAVSEAA